MNFYLSDSALVPLFFVIMFADEAPSHLFQVAAKKYCNFDIPADFTGVWRYLRNAYEREEFKQTCPGDVEIEKAYFSVANSRK